MVANWPGGLETRVSLFTGAECKSTGNTDLRVYVPAHTYNGSTLQLFNVSIAAQKQKSLMTMLKFVLDVPWVVCTDKGQPSP